jgi:hypothetical protein
LRLVYACKPSRYHDTKLTTTFRTTYFFQSQVFILSELGFLLVYFLQEVLEALSDFNGGMC